MKLSIIIPVYSEKLTVKKVLEKIKKTDIGNIKKEIIIVDDNSRDGTREILKKIKSKDIKIFYNETNKGKGYCIKKAIKHSTGEMILFQDADLEYDPRDYKILISALLKDNRKVIYGSRFLKANKKGKVFFYLGNKFLSLMTSILYFSKITDMETCYKLFKSEVIKNLEIKREDFAIEAEITAKLLKKGIIIKEVPIRYYPRNFNQGKKIKWMDGLIALKTLIYFRFLD